jgi:tetratricopeptide (TPR) repeat protein
MTSTLNEMLAAGRVDEASVLATRRLAVDPGDVDALRTQARVALLTGNVAQLETLLRRLTIKGATRDVQLLRAALAWKNKDWWAARGFYEQLTRQDSPPAEAWYGLGVARMALEDLEGAREALERAVELEPRRSSMRFELGRVLVLQRRERLALGQWVWGLRLEPRDVRGYLAVAELVARRGKARQARRVLERGLEALPGHAVLHAALEELDARSA